VRVERRRLSKRQAAVFGVTFYGGLGVAAAVGVAVRSFLAAVFTCFAVAGLVFLIGSVAVFVGYVRAGRRGK
jgi:hypothetical protein